ncbi:MAG: hypothetical protein JXA49_03505 [Actinobacteria bacterium]|nr:hypothetical protein [Actinomycetota bacterium]
MRKNVNAILAVLMFACMCCFAGCVGCSCDGDAKVHKTYPGTKETTQDEWNIPNEEKLGLPLYKNNMLVSSVESSSEETDGVVKQIEVDYNTKDDFSTVAQWYKDKLGEPAKTSTTEDGNQQMTWKTDLEGYENLVVVTGTKDHTAISAIKTKV